MTDKFSLENHVSAHLLQSVWGGMWWAKQQV